MRFPVAPVGREVVLALKELLKGGEKLKDVPGLKEEHEHHSGEVLKRLPRRVVQDPIKIILKTLFENAIN